jgi:hypothetical protein
LHKREQYDWDRPEQGVESNQNDTQRCKQGQYGLPFLEKYRYYSFFPCEPSTESMYSRLFLIFFSRGNGM